MLDTPERAAPLCEEAEAGGFSSNRAWAVAELRGLGRVNKKLQEVLLKVRCRCQISPKCQNSSPSEHVLPCLTSTIKHADLILPCTLQSIQPHTNHITPTAPRVVPCGVAFHHVDLTLACTL